MMWKGPCASSFFALYQMATPLVICLSCQLKLYSKLFTLLNRVNTEPFPFCPQQPNNPAVLTILSATFTPNGHLLSHPRHAIQSEAVTFSAL